MWEQWKCKTQGHCSHVGPHLGTLVPMGTKMSFLVPIYIQSPHFLNFRLYVKFNGNWCWTSPTWSQVQFWSSWSSTRRSRVELQLDQNWTWVELHEVIHHRLQSSPSRPSWSPTRRSRVGLQLGRDGLDWSCTRWTSVDSTQGHRVQVQVERGAAELNLDLDEVALSWSCTRSSTSTLRPSPSRPSWSSTRRWNSMVFF